MKIEKEVKEAIGNRCLHCALFPACSLPSALLRVRLFRWGRMSLVHRYTETKKKKKKWKRKREIGKGEPEM